ncbi:MAG: cytidine deaminase [Bacillota bacterium]|nr:cytidine deaminase [Bacillota bacterium]
MREIALNYQALLQQVFLYRKRAYAPYSGFSVGAALLGADGRIFGGCNIENSAYSPTLCAERTAFAKAISEGCRDFAALAVAGGPSGEEPRDYVSPCGVCRQWLVEFCRPEMPVILARTPEDYRIYSCGELLPHSFSAKMLCETEESDCSL